DRIIESYLPDKKVSGIVYPLYLHRLADKAHWETIFRTAESPEGKLHGVKRYVFLIQACRMIHQRDLTSQKDRFLEALALDLRRVPQGIFDIDRLMVRWGWREERIRAWDAVRKADSIPSDFLKSSLSSAEKKGDTILLYGIGQMLL